MRIRLSTTSTVSRLRLAGWFALALFALPCVASAAPRHHRKAKPSSAAEDKFIRDCVFERTGPDGGIPVKEALKLCTGIVKHQHRIDKAKARAALAIESCRDEVFVACEDTEERDHDGGECSAESLKADLAACVATEGK